MIRSRLARSLGTVHRPGLSLLEVVVALAILLFSVVAIGQLISIGTERALDVQQQAQGSMLCQRKLSEVMVGAEPLSSAGYTAFPDDGLADWQWKLDANPGSAASLWNVQVSVKYERGDGRTTEVQMGQMILDPAMRGSSQDAPPANASTGSAGIGSSGNAAAPSSGASGASAAPAQAAPAQAAPAKAAPAPAAPPPAVAPARSPAAPPGGKGGGKGR